MKFKQLLLTCLMVGMFLSSFAQLSKRSNDPSNFKFGTRPQNGDWGVNMQLYAVGGNSFNNYFKSLPIINVQHYIADDKAIRFGVRASKAKTLFTGESTAELDTLNTLLNGDLAKQKNRQSTREYMFYLGLEKHFAPTNLLDVYVGAQGSLGFSSDVNQSKIDYLTAGRKNYTMSRSNSLIYGLEAFIGLQAFVADLPVAVGIEWGLAGYGKLFNKTFNSIETETKTTEYYTTDSDPATLYYSKLSSRKYDLDNMVRFRISYYFNK